MNAPLQLDDKALQHLAERTGLPIYLDEKQVQAFGQEIDDLRQRIMSSLGEKDARYIRRVIKAQRWLEIGGRGLLFAGILPPAWLAGTTMLGIAKIIENMEIGHNVIHGQWDWMRDPEIHSSSWEWDNVCPSSDWKHSHNHVHHKWTNVVGKDRDVGYGILRMSDEQEWSPYFLGQPIYNALLAIFFEWGVALHDLEAEKLRSGEKTLKDSIPFLSNMWKKARKQVLKDYVVFPALAGPFFLPVLAGNFSANIIRNLWAYMIIFCGHFPEDTYDFLPEDIENEDQARWYVRQVLGSANIKGGKLMHLMSGNLSHQIEHHLFPDMPSSRYAEAALETRQICEKYGIPYNVHGLGRQFGTAMKRVIRLSLPTRRKAKAATA